MSYAPRLHPAYKALRGELDRGPREGLGGSSGLRRERHENAQRGHAQFVRPHILSEFRAKRFATPGCDVDDKRPYQRRSGFGSDRRQNKNAMVAHAMRVDFVVWILAALAVVLVVLAIMGMS